MRLIEFYGAEKDKVITFITNNFELGSLIIANIYRNRWQIETFFKWIKGNLTIKALWGYSKNAVKIHLWVAISTYLLLVWIKVALKRPRTITEISKVLGASLLIKIDIKELLNVPEPLTQNQNINEFKLDFLTKFIASVVFDYNEFLQFDSLLLECNPKKVTGDFTADFGDDHPGISAITTLSTSVNNY